MLNHVMLYMFTVDDHARATTCADVRMQSREMPTRSIVDVGHVLRTNRKLISEMELNNISIMGLIVLCSTQAASRIM